MTTETLDLVDRLRFFFGKRQGELFRPVPLAQALGEKDIRRVRAGLRQLRDEGFLVSCDVIANGVRDEEFRAAASGGSIKPNFDSNYQTPAQPRRVDHSALPSRLTDLTIAEHKEPTTVSKVLDSISVFAPAPHVNRSASRQNAIIDFARSVDRRFTARDVFDHFKSRGDTVSIATVCSTLGDLAAAKRVIFLGKLQLQRQMAPVMAYAVPEIADRERRTLHSAPVAQKTPDAACLADTSDAGRQSGGSQPLMPGSGPAGSGMAREDVQGTPQPPQSEARANLEVFFKGCDGNWYGFVWLVRVAGGDVPGTLDALATWQREKRLAYSEADRAPDLARGGGTLVSGPSQIHGAAIDRSNAARASLSKRSR
jgi:hypothetical protein